MKLLPRFPRVPGRAISPVLLHEARSTLREGAHRAATAGSGGGTALAGGGGGAALSPVRLGTAAIRFRV